MAWGHGGARGCEAKTPTWTMLRFDVRSLVRSGGAWKPLREGDGGLHMSGTWAWGESGERGNLEYELVLVRDGGALVLRYTLRGEPRVDRMQLDTTPCQYGGVRWWACCPRCDRRCAVLWGGVGSFACRICQGLAYTTSQLTKPRRFRMKVERLAGKLLVPSDDSTCEPIGRPRGMRRRTYERLCDELDEAKRREVEHLRRRLQRFAQLLYEM